MKLFEKEPINEIHFDVIEILKSLCPDASQGASPETDSISTLINVEHAKSPNDIQDYTPSKCSKLVDFEDLMDFSNPMESNPINKSTIDEEIDVYKAEVHHSVFNEPLDYWKNSNLKHLKGIAESVFVIPASSAEPERHNSSAGLTITDLRNRLNEKTVESLILYKCFLKKN